MKTIYIASSWKNQHSVEMLTDILESLSYKVNCFTRQGEKKDSINDFDSWVWSERGKNSFDFDINSAMYSDLVIYISPSGCDAWAEIGAAWAMKRPILGLGSKSEQVGLMRRMPCEWFNSYTELIQALPKYLSAPLNVKSSEEFIMASN